MEAMSWCFANNYKVIIVPKGTGKKPQVTLNIVRGKKIIKKGTELHEQNKKLYLHINNIYVYLYKKFNKMSFSS